jgi:hypothetical protein
MIYEPYPDEGFDTAGPAEPDAIDQFLALDGSSKAATWEPVAVERVTKDPRGVSLPEADFPGADLALIGRRRAVDALRAFLWPHVEFLPLKTSDGTELYVFNVLNVLDALDETQSEIARFDDGRIMHVRRAVFKPAVVEGADIFRLPSLKARTYVSDQFVRAVGDAGLTGLVFSGVWEGPD